MHYNLSQSHHWNFDLLQPSLSPTRPDEVEKKHILSSKEIHHLTRFDRMRPKIYLLKAEKKRRNSVLSKINVPLFTTTWMYKSLVWQKTATLTLPHHIYYMASSSLHITMYIRHNINTTYHKLARACGVPAVGVWAVDYWQ